MYCLLTYILYLNSAIEAVAQSEYYSGLSWPVAAVKVAVKTYVFCTNNSTPDLTKLVIT